MRRLFAVLAALLVVGAISARAQEDDDSPPVEASLDRIDLQTLGHSETTATGVTFEYIVRTAGEDGAGAAKKFTKRTKKLLKAITEPDPDDAPVTTLVTVDARWSPGWQANSFVFQSNFGQNPQFKLEEGATFTSHFLVSVRHLDLVTEKLARARIAQVLAKLADAQLTGAEDDVDILYAHLEADMDALEKKAQTDAWTKAKKRAETLARLANRKLGRATLVYEAMGTDQDQQKWGSNYFNFVFPMSGDRWSASLVASCDTQLNVSFELE